MTKRQKKWPGELGKPIRQLPVEFMTHGGRITDETIDAYNADVKRNITRAIDYIRVQKLPELAKYYQVGKQNYAGLACAIAKEFIKNFDGKIESLKKTYPAESNKEIALILAARFVKGFQYKPPYLKIPSASHVCDVDTKEEILIAVGPIIGQLAQGRPSEWDDEKLLCLARLVEETKRSKKLSEDIRALEFIKLQKSYRHYAIQSLAARLQEGKALEKEKKAIERKVLLLKELFKQTLKKQTV